MADHIWRIDGQRATVNHEGLAADVVVDQPSRGLRISNVLGLGPVDATLFALGRPAAATPDDIVVEPASLAPMGPVEDCYARGRDLVITYGETANVPLRYQVYWRLLSAEDFAAIDLLARAEKVTVGDDGADAEPLQAAGVELVVSAQTSVLDISPELICVSAAACLVKGLSVQPISFSTVFSNGLRLLQMLHSSDKPYCESGYRLPSGASGDAGQRPLLFGYRLFRHSLEKGVILRSRLRAVFTPAAAGPDAFLYSMIHFEKSPPPLTT